MKQEYLNHNYYLSIIKRLLGASFVGWVEEKESKQLRIRVKGKETLLPLQNGEIGEETYRDLIKNLIKNE